MHSQRPAGSASHISSHRAALHTETSARPHMESSGVQFQRPLCPFPQVARYTVGDPTNADNYKCVRDELDRDPRDH